MDARHRRRKVASDYAVLEGEANHLDGGGESEFVEDIGLMTVDGAQGDMEFLRDFFAEFACAACFDDFQFTLGE